MLEVIRMLNIDPNPPQDFLSVGSTVQADVWVIGLPCKGSSNLGRRDGLDGEVSLPALQTLL